MASSSEASGHSRRWWRRSSEHLPTAAYTSRWLLIGGSKECLDSTGITQITSRPPVVVVRWPAGEFLADSGCAIMTIRTQATMHDTDIVMSGCLSEWSIVFDTLTNNISKTKLCIVTEVSLDAELFRKERVIIIDTSYKLWYI